MEFVLLIVGLALILAGANYLTEGAAELARRMNISEFIVGVTIIGIGTSAPELVVSIASALKGTGDMAVGNVVGSNLFNVLIILGITAIITPLPLTANNIKKDIPFGVLASVLLLVCLSDIYLGDATVNTVSRSEGVLMLALFAVFLAYTIYSSQNDQATAAKNGPHKRYKPWLIAVMVIGGLAGLVYGGELFLNNALLISRRYGLSESVIAITLMAGGTSLPELASCVIAAIKKRPQLALGNILGSNISNIFLVLGTSAAITPLAPAGITTTDLLMVIISALLLFATAFTFKKHTVSRTEGIIFICIYVIYTAYLLTNL